MSCVLILTAAVYYPGLDSRFLLDDHSNLAQLEEVSKQGPLNYILSGISGPSGRPLSLLSFSLQYQAWPENPYAFKLVNLAVHLLNGVLIFLICRLLGSVAGIVDAERNILALLTAGLWLLHPMQVSTVLYTVQRMTELSALFTFLGMYAYLYFRSHGPAMLQPRPLVMLGIIIWLCTLLGTLSKENGILLPLLLLVTEFVFFNEKSAPVIWRIWKWIFLVLPLVVLAFYLASRLGDSLWNYRSRSYTPGERILTQAVVLVDYLRNLIVPSPDVFSLFHDDFRVSKSLLEPPLTLLSVLLVFVLLFISIAFKQKLKLISFGMLWFFAGHVLESSHLNLELYFEHRNYAPSFGIFFLMSGGFMLCWKKMTNKVLVTVLCSAYFLMIVAISISLVTIWSNPVRQAVEWGRLHPLSPRALDNLASVYIHLGEYDEALAVYSRIKAVYPDDIYPDIMQISVNYCLREESLPDSWWGNILQRAQTAKMNGLAATSELDSIILKVRNKTCDIPEILLLMRLVVTLATNPDFAASRGDLHELAAVLGIHVGDAPSALANINTSLDAAPNPSRHILKIKILEAMNLYDAAADALEDFKDYLERHPRHKYANKDVLALIEADIKKFSVPQP